MRRNGQPSRPNAITCCCFSSVKTLLTSSEGISLPSRFNVLPYFRWPVFRCPSLAGFGCPPRRGGGANRPHSQMPHERAPAHHHHHSYLVSECRAVGARPAGRKFRERWLSL